MCYCMTFHNVNNNSGNFYLELIEYIDWLSVLTNLLYQFCKDMVHLGISKFSIDRKLLHDRIFENQLVSPRISITVVPFPKNK